MATIQGTTGNDKVTVNSGDTYNALEGDDDITLMQWASTNPGKGNDTVRVIAGVVNEHESRVSGLSDAVAVLQDHAHVLAAVLVGAG